LLSDMWKAEIKPSAIASDNAVVSKCERDGQRSEALSLLREIGDATSETDDISRTGGIRACEKGGQWLEALSLARKIEEVVLETGELHCQPRRVREGWHSTTYDAGGSACEKGGQWPDALSLIG